MHPILVLLLAIFLTQKDIIFLLIERRVVSRHKKHTIISNFVFSYHRIDLHFLVSFNSDQDKKMLHGAGIR